tara:strand:+ start:1401 stop:1898 length:498 start_codon:yes stop_codon:yes gene_type:complete
MKFKDFSEFRIYLEDKLLSKEVIRKHMNIYEDTREMTDIKKDKTNQTWDWMKYDTLYLVRTNSAGVLTYLYAPKSRAKKSYEDSGFVIDDSDRKIRNIFYAQHNVRRIKEFIRIEGFDNLNFNQYDVGDWDAPNNDAKWVQAIFEVDLGNKLLMNWNNIPWEGVK